MTNDKLTMAYSLTCVAMHKNWYLTNTLTGHFIRYTLFVYLFANKAFTLNQGNGFSHALKTNVLKFKPKMRIKKKGDFEHGIIVGSTCNGLNIKVVTRIFTMSRVYRQ